MSWKGWEYNERVLSQAHNKLVHIILYGIDARGIAHIEEAQRLLADVEAQRHPGRQNTASAGRWKHQVDKLRRQVKEAEEVALGTRAPKLKR